MRRIDIIAIGLGIFAGGGLIYLLLQALGLNTQDAGIWSQFILVCGLIGWILSYLFRVVTQQMTYNRQLQDYQEAVLQKRLQELTPEELEKLQAEIEQENSRK
ncbi:MAG: DUF3007 family protein [Oscillatoriaceae bacterium SKW80]|nr:DUF3007 family protein [Oscillatoriaceae bacterium SKYG93]MCX8120292.1 DUF3007 family protein [Oscillatoriaceae bacterium SKW80]MDW8453217.1 DUF3007 family protein [Oscillatoriaceae cyanobacterium SKYGB_i_bin93]HIK28872.1 DUF3007 family protein [Oscillatoriaceae cyanobacterium M7585_C2015_266]